MVAFKIRTLGLESELLTLPWDRPLEDWPTETTVILPAGTHRHVVRFVPAGGDFVALKELPDRLAARETDILSSMSRQRLPVVTLIGTISERVDRAGQPLEAVLLTRHLRYSLPYSYLFTTPNRPAHTDSLVDALVVLLVRLHLEGFFWGDCSLNNALFRRDAGALRAYVVDTETAESHEELTDGQRAFDLQMAVENTVGGLLDLAAAGSLDHSVDPFETGATLDQRYKDLWAELTKPEKVSSGGLAAIHQRLVRLNKLGFDAEEYELNDRDGPVSFRPTVIEEGHHKRQLLRLTGIEAHENQARRLLTAIRGYGAWLQRQAGTAMPQAVIATRWLNERWNPTLDRVPPELRSRLEDAELYYEILEHCWQVSAEAGHDVDLLETVDTYVAEVLAEHPDERSVLTIADNASGPDRSPGATE